MKNENTTLLEVFTHPGTYQIVINGEVITNYLYYLHMMIDFQPSILADKAKSISTLTGDISNQEKFKEVM